MSGVGDSVIERRDRFYLAGWAAVRPLKSRPELLLVRMGVVPCSAVAPSLKSDNVTFWPRVAVVAAAALSRFTAYSCHQRDRLFLLVPTQLTSLVLVECGGRTIKESVLALSRLLPLSGCRAPPWLAPPASGAPRRVGGNASFSLEVVGRKKDERW